MDTPGSLLKTEREKQKKSLGDIEKLLKITGEYLRAIEKDDYEALPADVFTKSYLRMYAGALGLESDHILALYKQQLEPPAANEPTPDKKQFSLNLPASAYRYLLAACLLLAIALSAVYMEDDSNDVTVPADITPVAVEETVVNEKTNETGKTVKSEPIKSVTEKPAKSVQAEDLSLEIAASALTWVSVSIDSGTPEELLLRAGESKTLTAHEKFVIKLGNAGGTRLVLNGVDIGNLGPPGQVVDITLP